MCYPVLGGVGVILMIARHKKLPVLPFELSQWRQARTQFIHHAIGHIARQRDHVGLERLHRFNNRFNQ